MSVAVGISRCCKTSPPRTPFAGGGSQRGDCLRLECAQRARTVAGPACHACVTLRRQAHAARKRVWLTGWCALACRQARGAHRHGNRTPAATAVAFTARAYTPNHDR